MSAPDAARWMADKVAADGVLYQDDAAVHIERHWPDQVYYNESGGLAISRPTLKEFRKLTEPTLVWDRSDKCWRTRVSTDGPGRLAE